MMKLPLLLAGSLFLSDLGAARPFRESEVTIPKPQVTIQNGTYEGYYLSSFEQDVFLGIPYAQPPVDELRFRAPVGLTEPWCGIREAKSYGNSCVWTGTYTDNHDLPFSEDCLTLNIVRPSLHGSGHSRKNEPLPVAVWIHGGGFVAGASSRDLYNLSYPVQQSVLGKTPIIGVSINYRLSGFGFLASEEIRHAGGLNAGIQDQRLALKWIKENIAEFGGDPDNISLWGESGGAVSVAIHLVAYGGESETDLFHKGVLESGTVTVISYQPMTVTQTWYDSISSRAGCGTSPGSFTCLQKVPAETLRSLFNDSGFTFWPVIDGKLIPTYPKDLLAQGKFLKVPILIGNNMDEGTAFGFGNVNTTSELSTAISVKYPGVNDTTINTLLELYPNIPSEGCPYGTGDLYSNDVFGLQYKRGNAIGGDITMDGPRRLLLETWIRSGILSYSYLWNQSDYGTPGYIGATHFTEVVYVFDNPASEFTQSLASTIGPDTSGNKTRLAEMTSRYFMSFMATGDPNNAHLDFKGGPYWAKYTKSSKRNLYLSSGGSYLQDDDYRESGIRFINHGVGHQFLN
ncbi:Alpha/Beta hydrolase protein [Lipomyces starkeyi]